MSRHGRKVPTSYFHRFAKDACAFADEHAGGRVVSVLEGGYSDRALLGGTMAHVCGLVSASDRTAEIDEGWWGVDNLIKVKRCYDELVRTRKLTMLGPARETPEETQRGTAVAHSATATRVMA
jgi:hypothetical protein